MTASNDTRDMCYSATLWWMPTTREFGPRGGFGDLEDHQKLATRFGLSAATPASTAPRRSSEPNPNETQIRLSDGVYAFEAGALADSVTVNYLDYDTLTFDAAFKYKGFSFQGEFLMRRLSKFAVERSPGDDYGTPFARDDSIVDKSLFVEAMHMVVPKKLVIYAVGSYSWTSSNATRGRWAVARASTRSEYAAGASTCTSCTSIRARRDRISATTPRGQTGTTILARHGHPDVRMPP